MYRYCVAMETGLCEDFVFLKIGNYSSARWSTFGTGIIRVNTTSDIKDNSYVAECLDRMVIFIVNVYYKVN